MTDLLKIIDDPASFDAETREKATKFYYILTSRQFVVILHFAIDVMTYLSTWSKKLQSSNGLLFDKKRLRDETLKNLRSIVYDGGVNFSKLREDIECWGRVKFFLFPGSYRKDELQKKA